MPIKGFKAEAEKIKSSVTSAASTVKAEQNKTIDSVNNNPLYEGEKYNQQISKMKNAIRVSEKEMVREMCQKDVTAVSNGQDIGSYDSFINKARESLELAVRKCYNQQLDARDDELYKEALNSCKDDGVTLEYELAQGLSDKSFKIVKQKEQHIVNTEKVPKFKIEGVDDKTTAEQIVEQRVNQAVQKVSNSSKISQEEKITLGRLSAPTTPRINGQEPSSGLGMQ